ncbi:chloride channel protein [Synechococcus sp. KORDI-52]|uniref:chloride channel protein n=1 Tax=Synechococcus sp. KORDI-52 TaxID=585425 RepID=UPI000570F6B0|nr:chloride channel protein [Synechococcus sp. KORDI-52]
MTPLRLSLMALFTGALSGAGVAVVFGWIGRLSQLLWGDPVLEGLDRGLPLGWSLLVCGSCGLILSLLHRPGPATLLPELRDTLRDLREPTQAPKRDEVRGLLGASLALIGGGCIGPEALMSRMAALISQRIWRGRDQRLQEATVAGSFGLFGAPLLGGAVIGDAPQQTRRQTFLDRWLPGSLGGLAGFAAFHGIGAASGGSLERLPYIWPSTLGEDLGTLSAGVLGGVIGCGLGWLLLRWQGWLEHRQLLAHWPWWPLLTGLLLGVCMHWLPLVPFAGEDQMRPLLEGQNASAAWFLLLSALVKLLMLGLCLETGWRGGVFFPLFLVACAIGTGLHLMLPELGSLGSWCGALTGALYRYVLPTPLAVLVLGLALLQGHGAAGLLVGLAMAHLIKSHAELGGGPPLRP